MSRWHERPASPSEHRTVGLDSRSQRLHGERGTANALLIVVMSLVMLLAAGLALDGGRTLAARREAVDVASQAARAGAQAVSIASVRAGRVELDPERAVVAASAFLGASGHHGSVTVVGEDVVVTVEITVALPLLAIGGVSSTVVSGRGAAHIVRGISEADP